MICSYEVIKVIHMIIVLFAIPHLFLSLTHASQITHPRLPKFMHTLSEKDDHPPASSTRQYAGSTHEFDGTFKPNQIILNEEVVTTKLSVSDSYSEKYQDTRSEEETYTLYNVVEIDNNAAHITQNVNCDGHAKWEKLRSELIALETLEKRLDYVAENFDMDYFHFKTGDFVPDSKICPWGAYTVWFFKTYDLWGRAGLHYAINWFAEFEESVAVGVAPDIYSKSLWPIDDDMVSSLRKQLFFAMREYKIQGIIQALDYDNLNGYHRIQFEKVIDIYEKQVGQREHREEEYSSMVFKFVYNNLGKIEENESTVSSNPALDRSPGTNNNSNSLSELFATDGGWLEEECDNKNTAFRAKTSDPKHCAEISNKPLKNDSTSAASQFIPAAKSSPPPHFEDFFEPQLVEHFEGGNDVHTCFSSSLSTAGLTAQERPKKIFVRRIYAQGSGPLDGRYLMTASNETEIDQFGSTTGPTMRFSKPEFSEEKDCDDKNTNFESSHKCRSLNQLLPNTRFLEPVNPIDFVIAEAHVDRPLGTVNGLQMLGGFAVGLGVYTSEEKSTSTTSNENVVQKSNNPPTPEDQEISSFQNPANGKSSTFAVPDLKKWRKEALPSWELTPFQHFTGLKDEETVDRILKQLGVRKEKNEENGSGDATLSASEITERERIYRLLPLLAPGYRFRISDFP